MFPYVKKRLEILRPWCELIDSDKANRTVSLSTAQVNEILDRCSSSERSIGDIYMDRYEWNLAELHCQQAITYARRCEGKNKVKLLLHALTVSLLFYTTKSG
jgi:hypothetical protein